jgi:hypothetical protein
LESALLSAFTASLYLPSCIKSNASRVILSGATTMLVIFFKKISQIHTIVDFKIILLAVYFCLGICFLSFCGRSGRLVDWYNSVIQSMEWFRLEMDTMTHCFYHGGGTNTIFFKMFRPKNKKIKKRIR